MTHFIQLPNKTVDLLSNELALKDGNIAFEFGGAEKVLVTEEALQNAIAGMSAPKTVATKTDLDALTVDEVEQHQRIFVEDDGDGKWAYYMVTDTTGTVPTYIKVSDEDIFGALFSDDVTAQISKIGDLANLDANISVNLTDPITIIEAINEVYAQHVALKTNVGDNANLTTLEKGTVVGAINELKVNIEANDGDILTIQNNIGDLTTINLADAVDKESIVKAINKVIAIQNTKLDAEDVVPIIVSYTGLLTELTTTNKNSLVEAINEVVANLATETNRAITVEGDLANLVTTDKSNLVAAINEVKGMVDTEATRAQAAEATLTTDLSNEVNRATTAENTLQTNIDTETATRIANDGDLATLTTEAKNNLVSAINEVDANTDAEVARATAAEATISDNLNAEVTRATTAETALQTELDNTQAGAGLDENGNYVADSSTNYIATATSLNTADKLLDTQVKANNDAIIAETTRATTAEATLQANIDDLAAEVESGNDGLQTEVDAIESNVGLNADGSYSADTTTNYLGTAYSVRNESKILDGKVKENADAIVAETTRATDAEGNLQNQINTVSADLATETTARTDADTALDNRLTTVEDQVNGKIGDLNTLTTDEKGSLVGAINEVDANADKNAADLATEVTRATTAETTLQTNIDNEVARATAAEQVNTQAIQAEAATRATNDGSLTFDESLNTTTTVENEDGTTSEVVTTPSDLTDAINKENARAKTAEATLQANIDTAVADSTSTTDALRSDLDAEIARATAAEVTLDTKIDNAVSNLVDGAPELLDTLNELAQAINNDENFSVTIANDIANAKSELRGAASEAMDTMKEIEDAFNAEKAARDARDTAQEQALTDEVTRATTAETTLQSNIDAEATTRSTNDGDLTFDESLNTTDVDGNVVTPTNLTAAINAENARAKVAETTLTNDLASEVTRATTAENTLQANIDAEVTARTDADTVLDNRLTTVEEQVNGKIGDLNTLTTDEKGSLVGAINEVDTHIDAEVARATAAEQTNAQAIADLAAEVANGTDGLQTEIDAIEGNVGLNADGTFTADAQGNYISTAYSVRNEIKLVDAQVKVNTDAIAAETTRATGVENNLQSAIDNEAARAKAAEQANVDSIAAETTRATGAESDLQNAINAETTRAQGAEGNLGFNASLTVDDGNGGTRLANNLTEAVNAEVARASATETNITNAINDEVTRATAAESTLQSNIDNETARAQSAESQIASDLTSEVNRAQAAEQTLQSNIDNEATARTNADNTLQANIDSEAGTRLANDGTLNFNAALNTTDSEGNVVTPTNLTDAINAEVVRATTSESNLQTAIDNEVTRATTAENTLQTNIDAEVARATAAEQTNADAIAALEASTDGVIGDLSTLTTDEKGTVVGAINEVQSETDINTNQVAVIKAFINDMLSKSGKTVDSVSLVANTAYSIDITDLASINVAVTVYSVNGTVLSQEYGMFIDIDTANGTVSITSSIDVTVKVVIAADISGLTIA